MAVNKPIHIHARTLIHIIRKADSIESLDIMGEKIAGDFRKKEEWVSHKHSVKRVREVWKEQRKLLKGTSI